MTYEESAVFGSLHGYYNPSFGQGWTNFDVGHSASGMPLQPHSKEVIPTLPDLPGAHWVYYWNGGAPWGKLDFQVPVWSTPPAATPGNWATCELLLESTFTFDATPVGGSGTVRFEFETTEPMLISHSGWYFREPETGSGMPSPVNSRGELPAGHYLLSSQGSPVDHMATSPATQTLHLILGPVPVDTDRDGLSDYDEINTHHTNPNQIDTDEDGLSDKDEIRTRHTDPTDPDTDGDGYKDGFEYKSGKNPLDPSDAPDAYLTIAPAVELRILTKLGVQYRVQSSTDLSTWTDTGTLTEGTGDELRILHAADAGAKYWRVAEVP